MRLQLLSLTLVALLAAAPALAGDGKQDGKHSHGKAGSRVFCPHCGEACYPTVTKGKETKHCFNVETKTICIPKVRFPWEKDYGKCGGKDGCPQPKCGHTRDVHVLIKHEYECSVCKYSWNPESFKNGKGDAKYKSAPTEPETDPIPPAPTAARLDQRRAVPPPVEIDQAAQSQPPAPAKKTYFEILTGFFD